MESELITDKKSLEESLREIKDKIDELTKENEKLQKYYSWSSIQIIMNNDDISGLKKKQEQLENKILKIEGLECHNKICLDELNEIQSIKDNIKQQIDLLKTELENLKNKTPAFSFAKYEYYIFWYVNKTHELGKLISMYGLKAYSFDVKNIKYH